MLNRFSLRTYRTPKSRARGKRAPAKPKPRSAARGSKQPVSEPLSQGRRDLLAIALLGLAVYLAFLLWNDGDGGSVGGALSDALEWGTGGFSAAIPVALAAFAIVIVTRPVAFTLGPVALGSILALLGILLALAAETAGLGGSGARKDFFEPDFMREHGGGVGEVLYWMISNLFQRPGAHIAAVVMTISGLLLATGSEIRSLLRSGRLLGREARGAAGRAAVSLRRKPSDVGRPIDPTYTTPSLPDAPFPETDEDQDTSESAQPHGFDYDEDAEEAVAEGAAITTERAAAGGDGHDQETGDTAEVPVTPMGNRRSDVTESDEIAYALPSPGTLKREKGAQGPDPRDHKAVATALLEALGHFGVEAKLVGTVSGPHVSRYELQLAPGTKVGKISQLKDDLAYALASTDIRILAPIPGKRAVGVEVPNRRRLMVRLGDIYETRPKGASPLAVWLGKDVAGKSIWADLATMPHALVAGTTGSGKSGCINAMLCSILLGASPNEVRMVLVDPKRVELNHYEQLPHLLTPVVTSPRMAANVLANLIGEMESRYQVMGAARARNLAELNKVRAAAGDAPLPHILCVIDELADLMMVSPAEVEDSIIRLAQKSRAVGIHLVLATQRPSTDVITGTIKVNIPARIAFAVASQVDSRVILDGGGAESLLGQGDMLFRGAGTSKLQRVQGAFVTEDEIAKIAKHWATQGEPEFAEELLEEPETPSPHGGEEGDLSPDEDDLLEQAVRLVVETESASVSMIQRRLRVGYTRAGRLIDMLERRGVISGYEGSKARQVLIGPGEIDRVMGGGPELDAGTDGSEGEGPGSSDTAEQPTLA